MYIQICVHIIVVDVFGMNIEQRSCEILVLRRNGCLKINVRQPVSANMKRAFFLKEKIVRAEGHTQCPGNLKEMV